MGIIVTIITILVLILAAGLNGIGPFLFLAAIIGGVWLSIGAISPVILWIVHNPVIFSVSLFAYLLCGLGWSFFKWYKFVLKDTRYIDKFKYEAKKLGISPIDYYLGRLPAESKEIDRITRSNIFNYEPKVMNNIDRLSTWWICWPTSVLRYIVGDFLYDLTRRIAKWFSGIYARITENTIKSILK